MLYPLVFNPVLKERIWGGRTLEAKYGFKLPCERIGESWNVACHDHGMSTVANGSLKGKTLKELMDTYGEELLGRSLLPEYYTRFPLLIKILDACDILSVQVHPTDEYAAVYERGEWGKTEMWYVIDARPGARLIYGVKPGVTREVFENAVNEGNLEKYLNYLEVEPGDVVFIPAGMVHAIGDGILICEIQQNSDATYRVYDWNRVGMDGKPRELHVKKALDVIDFEGRYSREKLSGLMVKEGESSRTYYVACKYFAMEKLDIRGKISEEASGEKFFILTSVEGDGEIVYGGGTQKFKAGQSVMIPACLGNYEIRGQCTVIKAYVPDKEKDVIEPLTKRGFACRQLSVIAGLFE